jgi:2-amino-4-hydroxy-6-hydroxymethyldihydropteridine diphosphokinase
MTAETAYLLLGSNLGDREQNLGFAVANIEQTEGLELLALSSIYESAAVNMVGDNPPFLNQVIKVDFMYTPVELLDHTERIERALGRTDKGKRLARALDIDILIFGRRILHTERLIIPHRNLVHRPFALAPLLEIDPDLIHPGTGKSLAGYFTAELRRTVVLHKEYVARNI